MNAVPATAGAAGAGLAGLRPPARRPIADSGLRLLVGGGLRCPLRWSPDPDAPETRALHDGELRLLVHWVELMPQDLGRAMARARAATAPGPATWQELRAMGCAEVIESGVDALPAGRWLLGPLHLGTHQVVRPLSIDEAGCMAATAQAGPWRYALIPPPPRQAGISGPDAVERAVQALSDRTAAGGRAIRLSLCAEAGEN